MIRRVFFLFFILASIHHVFAQRNSVEILGAERLEFGQRNGEKITRLIGNVRMKQENTLLYCDSAYKFNETNFVEAYGHVHINNNDSVQLYGDELEYNGTTKYAKLKRNARMTDKNFTLTTDELEFDMVNNAGSYRTPGRIISGSSTLTSRYGYYYTRTKELYFKKDVVLIHPNYTINSDTMRYNTVTKVSTFFGPTTIISKQDRIYCEYGWYNTEKEISLFSKNAMLTSKENTIKADTIYYERNNQYGRGYGHIEMSDTINKTVVYGDYGELIGKKKQNFVTGHAIAKQYMEDDSLYVLADTLYSFQRHEGQGQMLKAYYRAKIFKTDMQAICDSMVYNHDDSTVTLYRSPVMWSGYNQVTADTIIMFMNNHKLDSFRLQNNSFIISREASRQYNQVKGKNMKGRFVNSRISYIRVFGNGQSIYYAKEDSAYIGVDVINCSEMEFFFRDNKITRGNFITQPDAVFYPLNQLKPEELKLKGFKWLNALRPDKQLIKKRLNKK